MLVVWPFSGRFGGRPGALLIAQCEWSEKTLDTNLLYTFV